MKQTTNRNRMYKRYPPPAVEGRGGGSKNADCSRLQYIYGLDGVCQML